MFGKRLGGIIVVAALASVAGLAQDEVSVYKNDAAVQAFGSFVKTTTENGIQQSATNSGGVLASYRFFFDKHNGAEVNYGYSLNTLDSAGFGVKTYSHEISAAYILRFPMRHWTPFVLAGAGGLVFDPKDFSAASTQGRAAGVYGAGADINLSQHVFLRAEYRGLIYNSPTFQLGGLSGTDRVTHRAEPSVGFGYRF